MSFFFPQTDSTDGGNARPEPWRCFYGFLRNIFLRRRKEKEIKIYPRLELPAYDLNFEYDMSHRHRGVAVIFNHEYFKNHRKSRRNATDKDRDRLTSVLEKFGFEVQVFDDLSFKAMESELERVSQIDHTDNDCLLITIMTHGDFETISSFDEDYAIEIITSFFTDEKCPSLKGKPRIFFIQACRGEHLQSGYQMQATGGNSLYALNRSQDNDSHDVAAPFEVIVRDKLIDPLHNPPNHQDFLVVRSTMPNHLSFRNATTGSWFIQDLCSELEENGTTNDILELLTHVNLSISQRESVPFKNKQILCISSMLTKVLYLNVKIEETGIK